MIKITINMCFPSHLYPYVCIYNSSDLQFSTDDEEFEEVAGEFENATAAVLGQGEGLARSAQPINYPPGKYSENSYME